MVEKYRGVMPPGSIWYRLTRDEALKFIESKPDIKLQLPEDKPLTDLDSIDIQAIPGTVADIEKMLKAAGLRIVTLYD